MVKTKKQGFVILLVEVIEMDLIQIGKFIAELRKEQKLTQEQLGGKLGVTNKTISRWENGNYLPPADSLLSMSELFEVSINEILSGKRLSVEEYKDVAETNLVSSLKLSKFSIKEKIEFYKKKWLKEHMGIMVIIGVCILTVMVSGIIYRGIWHFLIAEFMFLIAHCWRYNTMMSYVERNVYDKKENRQE